MHSENGEPVPRDLPDQQAGEGEDRWDVDPEELDTGPEDAPDADEAGAARKGAPRDANVHPEHPAPDESTG
ncbi:hypothetical protein BN159_1106 [Streptomyces davaonensis JCM 4913]|uniref:Uncharacterized protein n=1 Tax=Streptomyces davaonensis (strain DSM 101723 / JCM 4913 / KCC S-0913 / 768) TaxID=1214101 RepID=K4QXC5_STRDJ|nr:hypothetical protein [Streptomyces davaonensis]CCK25485.1 hypothetical protein BN159_1106 [Streptomyces davaonensis JCM 4913]